MPKIYRAPGAAGQQPRSHYECAAKKKKKKKGHQPAPPDQSRPKSEQTASHTRGRQAPPPPPDIPDIPDIPDSPDDPVSPLPPTIVPRIQMVEPPEDPIEQAAREERADAIAEKLNDFNHLEDYEAQIAFFRECMDQQLLDEEAAIEMLDVIYDQSIRREDRERFDTLLQELATRAPTIYEEQIFAMLEWRITYALVENQTQSLEMLLQDLSRTAEHNSHVFLSIIDHVAYHGYTRECFETLKAAWPFIVQGVYADHGRSLDPNEEDDIDEEDEELLHHEILDIAQKLIPFAIFAYLEEHPTPPLDAPLLQRYIHTFLPVDLDYFEEYVSLTLTPDALQCTLDDFAPELWDHPEPEADEEDEEDEEDEAEPREIPSAVQNLSRLLFAFLGYLHHDAGMSYARGEMGRAQIETYLHHRHAGILDSSVEGNFFDRLLGAVKQVAERVERDNMLCPDKFTLNRFMENQYGLLFMPNYYEIAALLECLPHWLDFLVANQLLDTQQHTDAMEDMREVLDEQETIWEEYYDDPTLRNNVIHAWGLPETWGRGTPEEDA